MQELEFNKDISEMEGAEARATLQDVRSKYSEARSDYEQAQENLQEYKESLEDAEDEAQAAREFFAEFAAEESGLDKETILDKFSDAQEIREEFLSDADFQLATEDSDEDDTKFEDNPEQSDNLPGDGDESEYSDRASRVISNLTVSHDE